MLFQEEGDGRQECGRMPFLQHLLHIQSLHLLAASCLLGGRLRILHHDCALIGSFFVTLQPDMCYNSAAGRVECLPNLQ